MFLVGVHDPPQLDGAVHVMLTLVVVSHTIPVFALVTAKLVGGLTGSMHSLKVTEADVAVLPCAPVATTYHVSVFAVLSVLKGIAKLAIVAVFLAFSVDPSFTTTVYPEVANPHVCPQLL